MVCAGWRADLLALTVSSQADAARRPSSAPRRGGRRGRATAIGSGGCRAVAAGGSPRPL